LKGYSVQELKKFEKEQEEREAKLKLEEERNRLKKIQFKRSKRLELLDKYCNIQQKDGWVVKEIKLINNQPQ